MAAYVAVNYANIDVIIAGNNIAHYERTGKIDVEYLGRLSYDAVPALVRLGEKHPDLPGLAYRLKMKKWELETGEEQAWQAFNLAKYRARRQLEEHLE